MKKQSSLWLAMASSLQMGDKIAASGYFTMHLNPSRPTQNRWSLRTVNNTTSRINFPIKITMLLNVYSEFIQSQDGAKAIAIDDI